MEDTREAREKVRALMETRPSARPPDFVNPLEKIEQLLTCPICLDRYKYDIILCFNFFSSAHVSLQKKENFKMKYKWRCIQSPETAPMSAHFLPAVLGKLCGVSWAAA